MRLLLVSACAVVGCSPAAAPCSPCPPAISQPATEPAAAEPAATEPAATDESQPAENAATTLVLVRHAEKASEADDPPLTDAGQARAEALEQVLAPTGVTAIYVSDFTRTRQTAAPLAERLGLAVQLYDPDRAGEEARRIVAAHPGETILVVGHKPSVPRMVNELLGQRGAPERMERLERYDDLVVVTVPAQGAATHTRLRYGTVTSARYRGPVQPP